MPGDVGCCVICAGGVTALSLDISNGSREAVVVTHRTLYGGQRHLGRHYCAHYATSPIRISTSGQHHQHYRSVQTTSDTLNPYFR